ncbi:MAG: SPOR domain-containing protein [Gallionella sp.]
MRKLFWILLLGNVVLYAVMKSNGFGMGEPELQAQPDLHGDMIRLIPAPRNTQTRMLPPSTTAPAPAPAPAPVPAAVPVAPVAPSVAVAVPAAAPAAAPAKAASIPDHPAATAASSSDTTACLEWGDFSGPDLARATAALTAMQLAGKLSRRQVEHDRGYWVYFPPLRNRAAVNRKIAEIKALGITDYFVVQGSGRWQNAISLGVFKTREAAQNYLNYMHTKGVHTAKVGERASKLKATIFMLDGLDAATVVKLTELQKDFPGSELNVVPCALTK